MKFSFKKTLIFFLFSILFISSVSFAFYLGKSQCPICPPQDLDFSLFWEAYYKLKENFLEKEKISDKDILYGAISGMVKSLGDPYSSFYNPKETERFIQEDIKGEYEGVGMYIGIRNNQLQVISPLKGTPAYRAGLKAGDKILAINGTSTEGMSLEKATSLIKGPKGTKVKLTIFREGWEKPKEFIIERAKIEIPTLEWELKEKEIAYIHIYQFNEKTNKKFSKIAFEILNSSAKKIILDLRNNPGGLLNEVVKISGWFLKSGDKVVIIKEKNKKEVKRAFGNEIFLNYPMVVLINQGTASGAEILAAALRENRNVKLIGQTSFGKGSVQEPIRLSDGSLLKITIAEWLTPNENSINNKGVKPDIEVKMTDEDFNKERDPQLEKALEIIKQMR